MAGDCTQADTDSPSPTTHESLWTDMVPGRLCLPSSSHVLGSPLPPTKGWDSQCLRMAVFHPQWKKVIWSPTVSLEPGHLGFLNF